MNTSRLSGHSVHRVLLALLPCTPALSQTLLRTPGLGQVLSPAARLMVFIVVAQLSELAFALPVRAQVLPERVQSSHVTRESVHHAVAATLTRPGIDPATQIVTPPPPDWAHVMALAPGTPIIVTVRGDGARREFVSADESTLTVRSFRELYNVEVIARPDVTEVHTVVVGAGSRSRAGRAARGVVGCFLGYLGGALAGGMGGVLVARAAGTDPSNVAPIFYGVIGGGVAGAILGSRAAAGPRTEDALVLIYRAPVRTVAPL